MVTVLLIALWRPSYRLRDAPASPSLKRFPTDNHSFDPRNDAAHSPMLIGSFRRIRPSILLYQKMALQQQIR